MVARGGRWVLGRKDEGYPPSLELLEDPPEELRGIGDPSALGAPCISIIGARRYREVPWAATAPPCVPQPGPVAAA